MLTKNKQFKKDGLRETNMLSTESLGKAAD